MSGGFLRLHLWMEKHRRPVLAGVVLLMAVFAAVSSRLELEEDILAILPQGDRIVGDHQYSLRKFRQIDRIYIDVGVAVDDSATLAAAADDLHAALSTNRLYVRVMYRVDEADQQKLMGFVTGALPTLFTEADEAALRTKLEPEAVAAYLAAMRRKMAGPEGLALRDVLAADPVGISALMAAKLLPLQVGFRGVRVQDGRITSEDGRHVLMMAEPTFPSSNTGDSRSLIAGLLQTVAAVEARHPGVHVAVTGGHRMAVDNVGMIQSDVRRCTPLGVVSMAVLCMVAYRRRWLAILTFLPSLFGMLLAAAAMAFGSGGISAISVGFASIAVGVTVDYAIHVVYHLDEAPGASRTAPGRGLPQLVLPVSIAALTSAAAFAVMAMSSLRGYRQIGWLGIVGVLGSAAFALLVLPLLVPPAGASAPTSLGLTRFLEGFHAWRVRRLPWLLAVVVLLSIAGAVGARRLRFDGDLASLNGITSETRRDEDLIRATWGDALGMTMVVTRGPTLESALQANDRIAERLAGHAGVDAVDSLSAVCPARSRQEANHARWRAFWTETRRREVRDTLARAGAELGFRATAFDRFWTMVDAPPAWVTVETFRGTPLETVFSERVATGDGDHAVATMLRLADRADARRLADEFPEVMVLDKRMLSDYIQDLTRSGLGRFALWTTLLVAVILHFSLSSIALTAATLAPLAAGLLWTFGAMGWMGLPVNLMNCIFVVFIVGVGEDYSLFLLTSKLDAWRGYPPRLAASSAAVLISALTSIFGFGVLIFARHPVLHSLGTTAFLGMVFSLVATVILTPLFAERVLRPEAAAVTEAEPPAARRRAIARRYRHQGRWVEQYVYWKLRTDPMFARLDEVVPPRGAVLDLGCGFGIVSHWLALGSSGRRMTGVDYDADKIRVARRTETADGRVRFDAQDMLAWDYPPCDAVLLLDALHYWVPAKQEAVLRRAHDALRPGGRLVLRDAARSGMDAHRRIARAERIATALGIHRTVEGLHFLSLDEWTAMARRAGFRDVRVVADAGIGSNVMLTATRSEEEPGDDGERVAPRQV